MCNLSRNAELSALEAHHAVQSRCWQDDSLLMCFVPSLAVIARINCPDHKIRESQAAINATPPVGASLLFRLSSVKAVAYKLPQKSAIPAVASEPTSNGLLALGARPINREWTK